MARVLILDPDPEARKLLEIYLGRFGHETVRPRAATGADVPDLVVVEPAAPAALRQAELLRLQFGALPIVCVSSDAPAAAAEELQPAAYLRKPARSALLAWAIGEALDAETARALAS